ncbi:hypothetical protein ACFL59_11125, partial [Planctomycetota bacterium]
MVSHRERRADWRQALGALGYRASKEAAIDYVSEDGSLVVELLERKRTAVRDLRAAFLQLAAYL